MMRTPLTTLLLLSICSISTIYAQENIMPQIPPSLVECYNTSYFMNRQNRLPASIDTLISLIEKIENNNVYNYDIRTLSVALLHRFRQDGIQRAYGVAESPGVIPYSPTGFQFPKFRLLLALLIPGNAINFPNNTLTREERCSIHFMLSSSIDQRVRGDENQVCQRLSQYRAQQRLRRSTTVNTTHNDIMDDVEILQNVHRNKGDAAKRSAYSSYDYDWSWSNSGGNNNNNNNNNNNQISQCPVENGVIWTPWGSVSAGALIAGVATGLQQQSVQLRTLLALSSRKNSYTNNQPQTATVQIDNRWAATLAGDLSEVALLQLPFALTDTASVGANGAWNSTVMPEWYFLTQRQNLQMTDAEIRGNLDGLIIALNIASWRSQTSDLKLSQLLRMYYSTNGVLNSGINACSRKQNFNNYVTMDQLVAQTSAFSQVLDREMQLGVTLLPANIAKFSLWAATALENYVPWMSAYCYDDDKSQNIQNMTTIMTNIFVFLDTTWSYNFVVDYVNFVLQRVNISPYASSVTLLSASNGIIIVNTTNYINDVYEQWNVTTHSWYTPGFSLPQILNTARDLGQHEMNRDHIHSSLGGKSMIALLIPSPIAFVSELDMRYALHFLNHLNYTVPDLHFLYYGGGALIRFKDLVYNVHKDLFPLDEVYNVGVAGVPVIKRISEIPRRLVNPRCDAEMYANSKGPNEMIQYIHLGSINFYRIMPNYFYGSTNLRYLRIQPLISSSFTVCSSRTLSLPYRKDGMNQQPDQSCGQTAATNSYSLDLSDLCIDDGDDDGYYYTSTSSIVQCLPLYVSIQAQTFSGDGNQLKCSDPACQRPDDVQFLIYVSNLVCNNAIVLRVRISGFLIFITILCVVLGKGEEQIFFVG